MSKLKKTIEYFFYLFVFFLPWQTVWIWQEGILGGAKWEYGTMVVYGSEIILWAILLLQFFKWIKELKVKSQKSKVKSQNLFKLPITSYQLPITVIFFVLWSGFSIIWSSNKNLSFYWYFHLLEAVALFFVVLNLKINWQKFFWTLILAGFVQSILAIWQFLSQQVVANKWLGIVLHLPADLGASVVQYDQYRWLRAYGSFNHPNVLGGFLVVCFLIAVFLYLTSRRWQKVFATVSVVVIFVGLFFSFSRSAWLAAGVGFLIFIIVETRRRLVSTAEKKYVETHGNASLCGLIKMTVYLIAIAAILFFIYRPLVMTRFTQTERLEIKSSQERLVSLGEAGQTIKNNWLLGVGMGNYTYYLSQKNPGQPAFAYQPVHNLYLLIFSELGIVGFIVFVFLCFGVFLMSLKILKNNPVPFILVAALLIVSLFDHYFWTSYFGLIFWWLVLTFNLKIDSVNLDP